MLTNDNIRDAVYEIVPASIIEQIIVFGSQARGDNTEDSDTDICVIVTNQLTRNEIKIYRYELNKLFASKYRVPTDILIKSSYDYGRFKNQIGAIEYAIASEGVVI
ncbi:MAG: nucleotidyltransferase domain-containing protein [Oscillospiraceae bacterium]|nr:nucleotidyltransferase domain-containing protein [Oscillospiraceae bacterium]